MIIGDYVVERPTAGDHRSPPQRGKVVYIHPEGRFYTVEFTYERFGRRGSFRESFLAKPEPMEEPEYETGRRGATCQVETGPRRGSLEAYGRRL